MRGLNFVKIVAAECDRLGVQAQFNIKAKKILTDGGKVVGLLAEDNDGAVIKVETSAVLICTGGYANNDEFRRAVSVVSNQNTFVMGLDCRHADGIKMAADAGADMAESLGNVQWSGPVVIGSIDASWQTDAYVVGVQPTLWVNQNAERFVDEGLWQENFPGSGIVLRNQSRTFIMFNEAQMQYFEENGPYSFPFSFGQPGTPMATARATFEALSATHIADTVEEAAQAAGLDPASLRATVDRYNLLCEKASGADPDDNNVDEDFGKKAKFMVGIETGPYWLCEVAVGLFTTMGGIKINEHCEVIDKNGAVIDGLYAGGADAGGLHGDTYDVLYCPGSAAGWAVNSGRLAAKSIGAYLSS
jgi:fumarate reductase flavoprotein subunit